MNKADISQLMIDVGPTVLAEEVREFSPSEWAVAFSENRVVGIELDSELEKLVLYTDLGKPDPSDEVEVYKLLLNVAAMWRDTGGLRMGLEPREETVIQVFDVSIAGLNLEKFASVLRNFADAANQAQLLLEKGIPRGDENEKALAGMMKV